MVEKKINQSNPLITNPALLLIEDDEADAMLITKKIKSFWPQSKIIVAKSLTEAYTLYHNQTINLILLDLNLPDGFGSKTVDSVCMFNNEVPIIVITGTNREFVIDKSLESGACNVISKSSINDISFQNILKSSVTKSQGITS